MEEVADAATKAGAEVAAAGDRIERAIDGLEWDGRAQRAAESRASREHGQLKAVKAAFDDLATAIRNGKTAMEPIAKKLIAGATWCEEDMFDVASDWTVTDTYNYPLAYAVAGDNADAVANIDQLKRERANRAANETAKLKKLAGEFHQADSTCAAAIQSAADKIAGLALAKSGLSPGAADGITSRLNSGRPLSRTQLEQ
ncbi:hypothetical protein GOARA_025_00010 [Gordonia araii NBRC 100433]|uniref:Uncharacterized protein n=1 Tax=Gordonia araii NBRC 100433 TaxID=1073574 RepID=G7GZD0_9ACTN|nr:hypothetical protein [Gordonia araii]NNG98899.1 hypothetical protein [Gordonia araii NBRC 100433]GAB08955.1 hypothetical protein GOARA_025_00010 [Gordonia araii NBRC 100433]